MKLNSLIIASITKLRLLLLLTTAITACAEVPRLSISSSSWKEEVVLHDGSTIVVKRSVQRGGRHEIGQQPPVKEEKMVFSLPITNENITWKSEFSKDIGFADLQPLLLDISQGKAHLVTYPVGCLSYNKWGRPNPPYVIFKYYNKVWQRITMQELTAEFKTPNLIISSPDKEVEKLGKSYVTVVMVQQANKDLTQPEFKFIAREPIKIGCEELVFYKGAWIGAGDSIGKRMMDNRDKKLNKRDKK